MVKTLAKICDFTIRVIMMFTIIISLVFYSKQYPEQSIVFGFLALMFVMAIITKGLVDIFSKE